MFEAVVTQKTPYNPLQKKNLAESIVRAILDLAPRPLSETGDLGGAGVYILYYTGDSELYKPVAGQNRGGRFGQPIYIGKAIPRGGRKGGFTDDDSASKGTALRDRLSQHHESIRQVENLTIGDFQYRALVVDEIFIPLGENMLIERFKPVWNLMIDGFGNKDPGNRRKDQYKSAWDVIHPGREFAGKLAENPIAAEKYKESLNIFYKTGKIAKPGKPSSTRGTEQQEDGDDSDA